ncbi:UNVERIFIED_CONTAM: hypothetical protein Sradi_4884100 [Sesamum radiatum]|uniref:Reverse transcriptase Ty1/copia-type domain-containing protein n=1 Tax=Sesamum radiatum TaxID=300843 RepID=A0AAW2MYB5_SESRA
MSWHINAYSLVTYHKGYNVLDLESNTILHSRDVVFYEEIFPYESTYVPSSSTPPIIPMASDDDDIPTTIPIPSLPDSEPRNYFQANKDAQWVDAMNQELVALDKYDTWELVALPPGKRVIGCRWVFKLKNNPVGSIQRHKPCLVVKEYNQIVGVDYFDCFSPVAKAVIVRILMAFVVA